MIITKFLDSFLFLQRNEPNAMIELLKNKANVDPVNKKKQTPLHIAVGKNGTECVKILLNAKANPSLKVLAFSFQIMRISVVST